MNPGRREVGRPEVLGDGEERADLECGPRAKRAWGHRTVGWGGCGGRVPKNPVEITTHYSLTTSRQLKLYLRPSGDVGKASKRPIRAFPKLSGALL